MFRGTIEITNENKKEWYARLKSETEIIGTLAIAEGVSFKLDNLESVSYLYITKNASFSSESLENIDFFFVAYEGSEYNLPNLRRIGKETTINSSGTLPKLRETFGSMLINSEVYLPELMKVREKLTINMNASLLANRLEWVGGLTICPKSSFTAENLDAIYGNLSIYKKTSYRLDSLQHVQGDLCVYPSAKFKNLVRLDGDILMNGKTRLKLRNLKQFNGEILYYPDKLMMISELTSGQPHKDNRDLFVLKSDDSVLERIRSKGISGDNVLLILEKPSILTKIKNWLLKSKKEESDPGLRLMRR